MMPQNDIWNNDTKLSGENLPSIHKEKKKKAKHNVSNVAVDVVECSQK